MIASQTFGYYGIPSDEQCEYLTLVFSPLSAPLRLRWRNNGLSADFLGDYVTTFLPANGTINTADSGQDEIRHAVTYIANELLENAMKYHERNADIPIGIHLELANDHVTVSVSNGISAGQVQLYKAFVERLLAENTDDLLIRQLEGGHPNESTKSGLGLLTMIHDYGVRLGWQFEVKAPDTEVVTVTTSAVLPLNTLSEVPA